MAKYQITGGIPLKGKIKTAGNKNAVLPCMVAAVLTEETVILENVPRIRDVAVMAEILSNYGVKISGLETDKLTIDASQIYPAKPDKNLVEKLRASVLLLGPLLARIGEVALYHPGGDVIGKRSIDTHLWALEKLGAKFENKNELYCGKSSGLKGTEVFLDEASVTATENILLAAASAEGVTIIKNAACEPHVVCLAEMLSKMGAKIEGVGSNIIKIIGQKKLQGVTQKIRPDHIETGTWIIAAAATGGEVEIENCVKDDLEMIITYFSRMNVNLSWKDKTTLLVKPSKLKAIQKIDANIWPGFPTDLISPTIVLATQATGSTLIHDWMYEGRMFFVDKLIRMGANIVISDPHRVVVSGPTELTGREIISPDIRAGMALVIAALCSQGKSSINRIELIERGYEKVEERLKSLGANIEKVDE